MHCTVENPYEYTPTGTRDGSVTPQLAKKSFDEALDLTAADIVRMYVFIISFILRGTIVNRTYGTHKNLYV